MGCIVYIAGRTRVRRLVLRGVRLIGILVRTIRYYKVCMSVDYGYVTAIGFPRNRLHHAIDYHH